MGVRGDICATSSILRIKTLQSTAVVTKEVNSMLLRKHGMCLLVDGAPEIVGAHEFIFFFAIGTSVN